MTVSIAIVGMACCYADARSPGELWENVLAQRRAFRRMPEERLRLSDYFSTDREASDCFYSANAAVIEGYQFDRLRYRIPASTFHSADIVHWLALDIAGQVLADAGFNQAEGLPHESTGVFLGNTLTGEFSRAATLRLRWPYVRRIIENYLAEEEWSVERRRAFVRKTEAAYKKPFPPFGAESLAGGLSNTIAGRICNYFDFHGGGYSVDGACASSLLAITNACSALTVGDLDVALAGGVDVSLDPFELVGFAKAGALATKEMRVYDARSNGFWPGEGCGFVLLMRHPDAVAQGLRIYAEIKGWGISSDGNGGITRPEVDGQVLAIERAYRRAGFGIETVAYFEGHGTGTRVGDTVELQALSRARRDAKGPGFSAAAIGSVKANLGHTKAAAGIAGVIKTAMALDSGVIPPTTGCEEPHSELRGESAALRTLKTGELWPENQPRRAGVSSAGFGGINVHVVMETDKVETSRTIGLRERRLISSSQDAELFLLSAQSADEFQRQVDHLLSFAPRLSRAELPDLAAHLESNIDHGVVRAAIVASNPTALADRLKKLRTLSARNETKIDSQFGIFFCADIQRPKIGFLFPGQGSPSHVAGGSLRRRFDSVQELYTQAQLDDGGNEVATAIAQPAIVTASLAALRVLNSLDVVAQLGVGHSLGELTALCWAGAFDEESLLRITRVRGNAMMELGAESGAMASIGASEQDVLALLNGERVSIASLNSPVQTVLSGEAGALELVLARARAQNLNTIRLPVSHAFHSPLVAAAAPFLAAHLTKELFQPLHRTVLSTVTGKPLRPETDLRELLHKQISAPVRFLEAITSAGSEEIDLWLEVGPGQVLRGVMSEITDVPVISIDAGGDSLRGLLCAIGGVFVLGQPINHRALFTERFTRSFNPDWKPKFFANPCELAPVVEASAQIDALEESEEVETTKPEVERTVSSEPHDVSTLDLVRQLVAERAELPESAVSAESRLLSDLHLNSITVSQLVAEVSRRLRLPRPVSPTDFADATIDQVAQALEEQLNIVSLSPHAEPDLPPSGIDSWVRPFRVAMVERALSNRQASKKGGCWRILAPPSEHSLAASLRRKLGASGAGGGVVVCLPPEPDHTVTGLLMSAARLVLEEKENSTFVLVQHGGGAAAFARTLHLEAPRITTCVVNVPVTHVQSANWIVAEAAAAEGFVEAHYDNDGRRYEPVLRSLSLLEPAGDLPLTSNDVLVVTGGGKGITAECAYAMAKESGVRLALIGIARPEADVELSSNLARMRAAGIELIYISADVTDVAQVRAAVEQAEARFGSVTGILHGAAINAPQLISALDESTFLRTLAVKVQGARNLLSVVDPEKLRLLVAFSSIIARTGLAGEAHYGLANEWLSDLTERWKAEHPSCKCIALEWSVWAGAGMGERLGRNEVLIQRGITPIPVDQGVAVLRQLLGQSLSCVPVVVTGRFHEMPTLQVERPELPFRRFLENPRVYYPDVELIVDVDLATRTDPYLDDHQFNGERLLPAVMGLEAMAQAAMALAGSTRPPVFENVNFKVPIQVPERETRTIRVAALARDHGVVEVAVRSEETGFQMDHFAAICRFDKPTVSDAGSKNQFLANDTSQPLPLDPERDLYGKILFHRGRFKRLSNYRILRSTECLAEIASDGKTAWFSPYLPAKMALGDPGARDAAMHAIQACIPHTSLLPTGIERLSLEAQQSNGPLFARAQERSNDGTSFVYDIWVMDRRGRVHETWEGLRLTAVNGGQTKSPLIETLLVPYMERRAQELIPGSDISVALFRNGEMDRQTRTARALSMALGEDREVFRRPDGKPEVGGQRSVSAAHHEDLTLAVAGSGAIGCDLERVVDRPPCVWRALLGDERLALVQLLNRRVDENPLSSATRVWAATECLKKAGVMPNAPLVFQLSTDDGWILLCSGLFTIATYPAELTGDKGKLVIAILTTKNPSKPGIPEPSREC